MTIEIELEVANAIPFFPLQNLALNSGREKQQQPPTRRRSSLPPPSPPSSRLRVRISGVEESPESRSDRGREGAFPSSSILLLLLLFSSRLAFLSPSPGRPLPLSLSYMNTAAAEREKGPLDQRLEGEEDMEHFLRQGNTERGRDWSI